MTNSYVVWQGNSHAWLGNSTGNETWGAGVENQKMGSEKVKNGFDCHDIYPCRPPHLQEAASTHSTQLFCHTPSICLSVCLSVCLSFCPSARLPICLSACLPVCLAVYLSVYLSVFLSVCLSVCLSVRLSIYLSVFLSICLSICLSACLLGWTHTHSLKLTHFELPLACGAVLNPKPSTLIKMQNKNSSTITLVAQI